MKIRRVAPWIVTVPDNRQYVFVQAETDEGITGWGEITGTGALPNRAVAAVVREMSSFLEGEDPSRIEGIWNKVFRAMTYVGTRGITSCALSGIDIALWDIAGKAANRPVYQLMGGYRDRVPCYASWRIEEQDHKAVAKSARQHVDAGFRAMKYHTGSMDGEGVVEHMGVLRSGRPLDRSHVADQ